MEKLGEVGWIWRNYVRAVIHVSEVWRRWEQSVGPVIYNALIHLGILYN